MSNPTPAQYDLQGRVAVVTGGAQGIGFATAQRLQRSGATVVLWDLDTERLPGAVPVLVGKAAFAEHYRSKRFNLPGLHAQVVNRMVFGNKVIDQERVTGVQAQPMDVAAVYEVTPAGIARVWFVSGE